HLGASRCRRAKRSGGASASPAIDSPRATPSGGGGVALAPPERAAAYRRAPGAPGLPPPRAAGSLPSASFLTRPPTPAVHPHVPQKRRRELKHASHRLPVDRGLHVLPPRNVRHLIERHNLDLLSELLALRGIGGADPVHSHSLQLGTRRPAEPALLTAARD